MMVDQFELIVTGVADAHAEDLDEACRNLRDELLDVDGLEVTEAARGPAPEGTRGTAELVLATLVATYYAYRNAKYTAEHLKQLRDRTVPQLARLLRHWLDRNKEKRATIRYPDGTEVDLTNLSEAEIGRVLASVERSAKTDVG